MLFPDLLCPLHCGELISVSQKPLLLAKCVWKKCFYGVLKNDPTQAIQDISEFNYTHDGLEAETLD